MLALLNLSPVEVAIIAIAAIVVFGRRLPQVAGQAAGAVQRLRRSLDDLRRETGIDREILEARRAVESAVPREVRSLDVRRLAREAEAEIKAAATPAVEPAPSAVQPPSSPAAPERPGPGGSAP
jgi:Sec-independent protein translocase protein TatA